MVGFIGAIGLGIAVALVVILVVYYGLVARRNSRLGSPGLAQRSRLTCSKCHQTFDYDYIPGASVTAIRLGAGRYMSCPLCHKMGYFDLRGTQIPRTL